MADPTGMQPPPMLPTEPPFIVPGRRRIHAKSLLGLDAALADLGVVTSSGTALAPASLTLTPNHSMIALRRYTIAPTVSVSIGTGSILRIGV